MAGLGAFGKLPALGDFFRFGLPHSFVEPWDRWLQEALAAARAALGDRWRDCYFAAPIWRFSLAAGLAGPEPVLGVLMPSVDRVGRHFPLTLAAVLPGAGAALHLHVAAGATFEALETVALAALDDDNARPEALAERLAAIAPPAPPVVATAADGPRGALALGTGPNELGAALAAVAASRGAGAAAVWSARLADGARLLLTPGLPRGGEIVALFDLADPLWAARPAEAAS